MMLAKTLSLLVVITFVKATETLGPTADLFRDLEKVFREEEELSELFDISDFELESRVAQVLTDHGFGNSRQFDGFFSNLWGMFRGGDKKKSFASYNFVYQIACYQNKVKGPVDNALFGFRKYNEYGCHCGGGHSYGKPLDETDRCCFVHDKCYTAAEKAYKLKSYCPTYSSTYTTTCNKKAHTSECNDKPSTSARALCECDRAMAKCVSSAKALRQYRDTFKNARVRSKSCKVQGKKSTRISFTKLVRTCRFFQLLVGGKTRKRRGWLFGKK